MPATSIRLAARRRPGCLPSRSPPPGRGDPRDRGEGRRQPLDAVDEVGAQLLGRQQLAAQQLRSLAKPYRFRVRTDAEGFPIIPGRYGQIEWFDGCELAVYTNRPRLFAKLWAIPGVRRHQTGDDEMRAVFPLEALEQVAGVIRARLKRTQTSPQSLRNLRSRVTPRSKEPRLTSRKAD